METTMTVCPVVDTYSEVKALIDSTVERFIQHVGGGEFEELRSRANLTFMQVYRDPHFDFMSGKWTYNLTNRVWFDLLEDLRTMIARNNRLPRIYMEIETIWKTSPCFDCEGFMEDLSEDARFVIELVLQPSPDMNAELAIRKKDNPYTMKLAIRSIAKEVGWDPERTNNAFAEITQALSRL